MFDPNKQAWLGHRGYAAFLDPSLKRPEKLDEPRHWEGNGYDNSDDLEAENSHWNARRHEEYAQRNDVGSYTDDSAS